MSENRLPDYLDHLWEAARQACSCIEGMDEEAFLADKRTQQAVILNIVIIGEVATKLIQNHGNFLERHPDVPWRNMKGMRNRIAHGYFDIDLHVVWETGADGSSRVAGAPAGPSRRLPRPTMNQKLPFRWLGLLLFGWLVGCATVPPVYDPIQDANFQGPTLVVARAQPEAYLQAQVRWGGAITRVDNRREETWLEIVEQPLGNNGRPTGADASAGRFLARFSGFLDPAIYAAGRSITVVGLLTGTAPGQVGDYRTTYLVVTVERHRLWPERRAPEVIYVPDPFWYGAVYPWGYRRGFW